MKETDLNITPARTEKRIKKISNTLKARQFSLRVVLENIHDPHNVSAILRTCDAVGVPKVSLLYYIEKFPKFSRNISGSAKKWIEKEKFTDIKTCYDSLRNEGCKIYASTISESSVALYDLDLSGKAAIVLGNEHRGVSKEAAELADVNFIIPMYGMVQSLNVSVAAAVTLYEAMRQRREKGMYDAAEIPEPELNKIISEWCSK